MAGVAIIVGAICGIVGMITAISSAWHQRRQTLIMGRQWERQLARDLDAPEDSVRASELRGVLNRRLGDVRRQLRDEFNPKLDSIDWKIENIERTLDDSNIRQSVKVVTDAVHVMSTYKESAEKIDIHDHELQSLQHAVEAVRRSIADPATARTQIRGIAEQLLKMVNADSDTSKPWNSPSDVFPVSQREIGEDEHRPWSDPRGE